MNVYQMMQSFLNRFEPIWALSQLSNGPNFGSVCVCLERPQPQCREALKPGGYVLFSSIPLLFFYLDVNRDPLTRVPFKDSKPQFAYVFFCWTLEGNTPVCYFVCYGLRA